jgi:hypothetical protein
VKPTTQKADLQQKMEATIVTNLRKTQPSDAHYLFAQIGGKLKKKSLNTKSLSVAKQRLVDALKVEYPRAMAGIAEISGRGRLRDR